MKSDPFMPDSRGENLAIQLPPDDPAGVPPNALPAPRQLAADSGRPELQESRQRNTSWPTDWYGRLWPAPVRRTEQLKERWGAFSRCAGSSSDNLSDACPFHYDHDPLSAGLQAGADLG